MGILSPKAILAVTAVVDIAVHSKGRPVSAKALAARQSLPPRHLEPVLQAFVRMGLLRGIRGPGGGYALARDPSEITAEDILRAAGTVEEEGEDAQSASALLADVVMPAMAQAERMFAEALGKVCVSDMVRRAETLPSAGT